MTESGVAGHVVVGADEFLSEKRTLVWEFRNFPRLPEERGHWVSAPPLMCHGHLWSLNLYPRGGPLLSDDDSGWISIGLHLKFKDGGPERVKVRWGIRVGSLKKLFSACTFTRESDKALGSSKFVKRDTVLNGSSNFLVDGTLKVEVDLQSYLDKPEPFLPRPNNINRDMLQMLESGKWADVTFSVGDTKFRAHRSVLCLRAPALGELAEDSPAGAEIPIENVDEDSFRSLLRFAYAEEAPSPKELRRNARRLLEVADRFGCSDLKLLCESDLVASGISAENAADLLLLADARSCALLKEAAMTHIVAQPTAVMSTPGWDELQKSAPLLAEIMEVLFGKKLQNGGDDDGFDHMNVASLRRKLDEAGLDGDGTREMLVKRLKKLHLP